MPALRVHVLALRDCTALVPVGLVDLLRKSITLAGELSLAARDIEITLVSATREPIITLAGGVRLHCDAVLHEISTSDLVLVPAVDPDIAEHLERNADVPPWLRRMHEAGADIASACTGAFLVAEAGLLDRRSANGIPGYGWSPRRSSSTRVA